jgi:hypothetical protein
LGDDVVFAGTRMNASATPSEPPSSYDRDLDRRLTVLETRFDIILPTLATKADMAELRAEIKADMATLRAEVQAAIAGTHAAMGKLEAKIQRWMIGMLITLFVSQTATVFAIVTLLRPA